MEEIFHLTHQGYLPLTTLNLRPIFFASGEDRGLAVDAGHHRHLADVQNRVLGGRLRHRLEAGSSFLLSKRLGLGFQKLS